MSFCPTQLLPAPLLLCAVLFGSAAFAAAQTPTVPSGPDATAGAAQTSATQTATAAAAAPIAQSAPAQSPADTSAPPANRPPPPLREDERLTFMTESNAPPAEAPSAFGLLARTFGALLLITGLIVAAGYGLKKFGGPRFGQTQEGAPDLTLLSSLSLGEKRSLAVVRFGQRTLLVGSTPQTLTLLSEEDELPIEERQLTTGSSRSVAELLRGDTPDSFRQELSKADHTFIESAAVEGAPRQFTGAAQ